MLLSDADGRTHYPVADRIARSAYHYCRDLTARYNTKIHKSSSLLTPAIGRDTQYLSLFSYLQR